MVPEIALTSQIVHRFQAQFGSDVVVLHSSLQKRTRWDGWRSLATGRAKIAIGARSAIFAPVHNLGIIILDEEHDSSYKGHESFRYHAKDVALIRAKVAKCSVVLGSATPSLETMYGVKQKKITYVPLPKRKLSDTHKNLVHVVDMLLAKKEAKKSDNISLKLFNAIQEAISRNEQSFVLFNRRGFATYLQCDECGDPLYCKHCDVTMTFHQKRNLVACHYCGAQFSPPKQCFTCINERSKDPTAKIGDYVLRGAGTEKVFEELQTLFPKNKVVRLDRDVADNAEEYEKILDDVRGQKIDIVVGTQIIAKGHDLPGVTVVGVVDCDVALHLPDFRAGERMAQLLIQVAGRAGRHKEHGQVFLQTRVPLHPAVLAALHDNYNAFARSEMEARLSAWYPPYAKLLRIVVQSKDNELASKVLGVLLGTAIDFVTFVEKEGKGRMEVLGPVQASIAKIKDEWRWHGIVKAEEAVVLSELVRVLKGRKHQGVGGKVRVNYDLDPVDMM